MNQIRQQELVALQAELDALKTSLAAAHETIVKHEQQLQDRAQHEDDLEKLRAEVVEKQQHIVTMGDIIESTRREMEAASKSASDKVKGQLIELQASSAKSLTDLQVQLTKCNDELTAVTLKHTEMTAAKATADQAIVDLKKQLTDLQTTSSKSMAQIDDLERQLASSFAEISNKDEEIIGLQFLIDELAQQKRTWEEQASTNSIALNEERAQMEARLSTLLAANAASEAQSNTLMNSLTQSKNNDAAVTSLLTDLQIKLADDRTQLSHLEQTLGIANAKIKKHEVAHASLVEELAVAKQRSDALNDEIQRTTVELADQIKLRQQAEDATAQHIKELASATLLVDEATTSTRTAQTAYDRNIADLRAKRNKEAEETAKIQQQLADLQVLFAKTTAELQEREKKSVQVATTLKAAQEAANNTIQTAKKELLALQESSSKTIADLQVQSKQSNDELAVITMKYTKLASEKSTEDERVKELERLMRVDSDALDNTKRLLIDAQQQIQRFKDELTAMTKIRDELAAEKATEVSRLKEVELLLKAHADEQTKTKSQLTDVRATAEKDRAVLKQQLTDLQTSSAITIADLQAQLKSSNDEIASMAATNTQLTTAKAATDKEIEALKKECKLAAEMATKSIADLETANSQLKDQMTALVKEYQAYKSTTEQTASDLTANLAKVKDDYAQHLKECKLAAEKAAKCITDLQKQLQSKNDEIASMTRTNTQLTNAKATADKDIEALKKQLSDLRESSSQTAEKSAKDIANLETANKQMKDQMAALVNEYQSYKATTEKTASDLNTNLVKVKDEHAQHLKECKLAAEKAAKSLVDLQAQLHSRNEVMASMTATNADLTTSLNAITIEHRQYKETKENNSRELTSQNKRDAASLSALRKQVEDVTKLNTELTSVKGANDNEIEILKKKLSNLQESSSQTVSDLQSQLQKVNDEFGSLTSSHTALIAAKDRDNELLTSTQREVKELALALQTTQADLLALGKKHSALVSESQKQSTELVTNPSSNRASLSLIYP